MGTLAHNNLFSKLVSSNCPYWVVSNGLVSRFKTDLPVRYPLTPPKLQNMPKSVMHMLSYFWSCCNCNLVVDCISSLLPWTTFEYPSPPYGRVEGSGTIVKWRIHIREEVPDMPNHDPHNLILWNYAVYHQTESHQNPWKIRGCEHKEP